METRESENVVILSSGIHYIHIPLGHYDTAHSCRNNSGRVFSSHSAEFRIPYTVEPRASMQYICALSSVCICVHVQKRMKWTYDAVAKAARLKRPAYR